MYDFKLSGEMARAIGVAILVYASQFLQDMNLSRTDDVSTYVLAFFGGLAPIIWGILQSKFK
jgi:hypothetical protein